MNRTEQARVEGPAVTPAERAERLARAERELGDSYWRSDAWDLKTCPLASADAFRNGPVSNRYIRFGALSSASVRTEVKCVLHSALADGRSNPRTMWIRRGSDLASIARFLDEEYRDARSLADIDVEHAVAAYASALEKRGVRSTSTNWKTGANGVKRPVETASYHLTVLRELLEGARLLHAASDPWAADVWDVRKLNISDEKKARAVGSVSRTFDFRAVGQPGCRAALKSYLQVRLVTRWSVSQTEQALHRLAQFFRFLGARYKATDAPGVTQAMIREWLAEVSTMKTGPTTRNRYRHALEAFLRYCDETPGLFATGLSVDAEAYEEAEHGRRRLMTPAKQAQLKVLIDGLPEPYRQILQIIRGTGWRVSEVLSLTPSCLRDGPDGCVELHCIASKTRLEEVIPLVGQMQALEPVVAFCIERSKKLYGGEARFLFPSRDPGRPCSAGTLYRALDETSARLKLNGTFRPHDVRHLRLTELYALGMSAVDIAVMVGHRSTAMTDSYIHPAGTDIMAHLRAISQERAREVTEAMRDAGSEPAEGGQLPGDELAAQKAMAVGRCTLAKAMWPCTHRQSYCILKCLSWKADSHDAERARAYRDRLAGYCTDQTGSSGLAAKASQVLAALEKRMAETSGK